MVGSAGCYFFPSVVLRHASLQITNCSPILTDDAGNLMEHPFVFGVRRFPGFAAAAFFYGVVSPNPNRAVSEKRPDFYSPQPPDSAGRILLRVFLSHYILERECLP